MKKRIIIAGIVVFVLLFSGCGKSEEAQAVEDAIAQIGEVTLEKAEQIHSAREQYDALSANDSKHVSNLQILVDAEEELAVWEDKQLQYIQDMEAFHDAYSAGDIATIREYGEICLEEAPELDREEDVETIGEILDSLSSSCFEDTVLMRPTFIVSPEVLSAWEEQDYFGIEYIYFCAFSSRTDLAEALEEYTEYAAKYYDGGYNEEESRENYFGADKSSWTFKECYTYTIDGNCKMNIDSMETHIDPSYNASTSGSAYVLEVSFE